MRYLTTMVMLLNNAMEDERMQGRINAAREKYADNGEVQFRLDIKQTALDQAIERNRDAIGHIAEMN